MLAQVKVRMDIMKVMARMAMATLAMDKTYQVEKLNVVPLQVGLGQTTKMVAVDIMNEITALAPGTLALPRADGEGVREDQVPVNRSSNVGGPDRFQCHLSLMVMWRQIPFAFDTTRELLNAGCGSRRSSCLPTSRL